VAGIVEILMRLKGDSKDAVGAFDQTTAAAKRTEAQVQRTAERMRALGSGIRDAFKDLGSIAGIGTLSGIVQEGLENAAQVRGAAERTAFSGSAAELQKNFFNEVVQRSQSLSQSGGLFGNLRSVGIDIGRRVSGRGRPVSPSEEREAIELFRDYARNQPEVAQAILQSGNLDRIEYLRPRFQQELANANRGRTYMGSLQQGHTTINNIYPKGVNPRAVDQNMSRYERVNGRPRRP